MKLFNLGKVVVTKRCLAFSLTHQIDLVELVERHQSGDFGDLGKSDKAMNNTALSTGKDRIFSVYVVQGTKFYLITEWDRSYTTIMLASDY